MTYLRFLGWAAFYLLVSAFPLQAGAKKENNPSTTSGYFAKPLRQLCHRRCGWQLESRDRDQSLDAGALSRTQFT